MSAASPTFAVDGKLTLPHERYHVRQTGFSAPAAPRASIVIPALNEERLIARFLSSFTQELRDDLGLEIIVSDGGSDDATVDIAGEYADYVVMFCGPERQTIAEGRNAGARIAGGDVLIFLNADIALPIPVERFLTDLIDAASDSGAATCNVAVCPDRATFTDRFVMNICNLCYSAMNRLGLGAGRGECHVVVREAFEAVGGYDNRLVAGEDFELFGRLAGFLRAKERGRIRHLTQWSVYEDPRRYRQLGYFRTLSRWTMNYFAVTFLKKSHSRAWEPVR